MVEMGQQTELRVCWCWGMELRQGTGSEPLSDTCWWVSFLPFPGDSCQHPAGHAPVGPVPMADLGSTTADIFWFVTKEDNLSQWTYLDRGIPVSLTCKWPTVWCVPVAKSFPNSFSPEKYNLTLNTICGSCWVCIHCPQVYMTRLETAFPLLSPLERNGHHWKEIMSSQGSGRIP